MLADNKYFNCYHDTEDDLIINLAAQAGCSRLPVDKYIRYNIIQILMDSKVLEFCIDEM